MSEEHAIIGPRRVARPSHGYHGIVFVPEVRDGENLFPFWEIPIHNRGESILDS